MVKTVQVIVCLACFSSCKITYDTISRSDYLGNEFRIDGYYYSKFMLEEKEYIAIYFFYENGVELHWKTSVLTDFKQLEVDIQNSTQNSELSEPKDKWAAFHVNNNRITLETWAHTLANKKGTYLFEYEILNDTTLYSTGLKTYFHFKRFDFKPDSTYSSIK